MNKFDRSIAVRSKALGGGQGSGGSFLSCLGFMAAGQGQEKRELTTCSLDSGKVVENESKGRRRCDDGDEKEEDGGRARVSWRHLLSGYLSLEGHVMKNSLHFLPSIA